ncbi:MAG TPA: NgoMIV family type II restriction endonuclease [Solirubrobacteraceae bacterium]|jgi:hypothetical protein|nr:NgoMIV family type II restriction endonuclease [Solirubrobacteraceae bacterium]
MPTFPFVRELLGWNGGNPNIADRSSAGSRAISECLLEALGATQSVQHTGQTAGMALEVAVRDHLASTLPARLHGCRVEVSRRTAISDFGQYAHLAKLERLIKADATGTLRASIGTDYEIKPDVTVGLASASSPLPFLHAAVQCKWTLRSDRAQNVRHDAVILIRHRRGRLPHIVPVTAEPMPTRLASLARGTAEVDTLYHVALDELDLAVRARGSAQQIETLDELVTHDRLRDLSELVPTLLL